MFLIKVFCFTLIVTIASSKVIKRIDDDLDFHSNINKIREPQIMEEFQEIIQISSLTTETPKPQLKEKLSFMDMVVLLALWNKERELNNYNSGPFPDQQSVSPMYI